MSYGNPGLKAPQQSLSSAAQSAVSLSLTVAGAITPHKISDDLAYQHFIRAIATSSKPPQMARRSAFLARIGLSRGDKEALIGALNSVRERLDEVADKRRRSAVDSVVPRADVALLNAEEDGIVGQARGRIRSRLTPAGRRQLDEHTQGHIKRRITIYGSVAR
jgi:hypothetical protein